MGLRWRRVVSLTMLLLAAVLTYTGLVLYIAPQGRIAYWSDWHFLGLDKGQLGAMHTVASLLFVVVGWLHTYYNWKPITTYLKNKARQLRVATREMVVAGVAVGVLTVGTAADLPPFAQLVDVGEAAKLWWEQREGSPPFGHAELSSVASLAARRGLSADEAVATLTEAGVVIDSADAVLLDVARANGRSPGDVYALLSPAAGAGGGGNRPAPSVPPHGSGIGRRTLLDHCATEGLALDDARARLRDRGLDDDPGATLKEIATAGGVSPHDVAEWVSGAGPAAAGSPSAD